MSDSDFPTPELNVFLIASHVVYGYVGNKTASYVMQALGCNVSALNTVHFSNHTGYGQWRGGKLSGDEMRDIWAGLKKNDLTSDFDLMLTGYCPGPEAVEAAGFMARELKTAATTRPGSFFWILDPVMGDNGRLYVDPAVVPVYRGLIDHADLIVPNQFELETLAGTGPDSSTDDSAADGADSGASLDSPPALLAAIESVHTKHRTPHVLVTSVKFAHGAQGTMSVVGSSRTSDGHARAFRIDVPVFDCFFSGSGDLLASLLAVRLHEAAGAAGLLGVQSWLSPDHVAAVDLPLARAAEKVLASMHVVLQKTMEERDRLLAAASEGGGGGPQSAAAEEGDKKRQAKETKAAEVRIVRNVKDLLHPPEGRFEAKPLDA